MLVAIILYQLRGIPLYFDTVSLSAFLQVFDRPSDSSVDSWLMVDTWQKVSSMLTHLLYELMVFPSDQVNFK